MEGTADTAAAAGDATGGRGGGMSPTSGAFNGGIDAGCSRGPPGEMDEGEGGEETAWS